MSIKRRPGRPGFQVFVKRGSTRLRRQARTFAEAQRLETRLRAQLERSAGPARGLEDALSAYLDQAEKTHRSYSKLLSVARWLRPYIEGRTIEQAPQAAAELAAEGLRTRDRGDGPGLSPATLNRRLAMLRRLCNLAYEWGWTDQPVGPRIKLLRGEQQRHVFLTVAEVEALASRMPRCGDFCRALAYTGLRKSELFLADPAQLTRDGIVVLESKAGKPRIVPVHQAARKWIKLPWLFTDQQLRLEWDQARKSSGMQHVRLHDLRHTFASWLAQAGVSDRIMAELLGHQSAQMTRRYAHLRTEALAEAVGKLAPPKGATRKQVPRK